MIGFETRRSTAAHWSHVTPRHRHSAIAMTCLIAASATACSPAHRTVVETITVISGAAAPLAAGLPAQHSSSFHAQLADAGPATAKAPTPEPPAWPGMPAAPLPPELMARTPAEQQFGAFIDENAEEEIMP